MIPVTHWKGGYTDLPWNSDISKTVRANSTFAGTFFKEYSIQKQPPRVVLRERYSKNIQQIYRRTLMPKCDFNKVALQVYWNHTSDGYSPVNLLPIFRTPFTKNTSGWLLLSIGWQTFHMWLSSYWCLKFTKISEPQKLNSLILPEVKGLGNIFARKFLVKYLIVLYLYQFCYQFILFRFLETTT